MAGQSQTFAMSLKSKPEPQVDGYAMLFAQLKYFEQSAGFLKRPLPGQVKGLDPEGFAIVVDVVAGFVVVGVVVVVEADVVA